MNYYELLEVPPNATDAELKEAYRKFALKYHPDRNPQPDAEANFREGSRAYNTLRDPDLRAEYDLFELGIYQGQSLEDYLLQRPQAGHQHRVVEAGCSWKEVEMAIIEGDWSTVMESFGFSELLGFFKRENKGKQRH